MAATIWSLSSEPGEGGALLPPSSTDPIALPPNPIERFYRGRGALAAFRADAGHRLPPEACEDWVGSVTETWLPSGVPHGGTGLSRLADGSTLIDWIKADPVALTGRDAVTTGLLVKLLDAGERLPVHCHPSREFASRVLASPFGKAEAWIVLAARPETAGELPTIWLGWREGVSRAQLGDWIERQDPAMLDAMAVRRVQAGDVWFVPPGVPHAIGAGIFMVEVQEPSDFSIVAETAGFPIDPADAHLRRGWEVMLDAFDRQPMTDERLDGLRQQPSIARDQGTLRETRLLGPEAAAFFRASRLTVDGESPWPYRNAFAIGVVTAGVGAARGEQTSLTLRPGITFGVSAAAGANVVLVGKHNLEIVVCLPSDLPPS